jgi:hypothetical protein
MSFIQLPEFAVLSVLELAGICASIGVRACKKIVRKVMV